MAVRVGDPSHGWEVVQSVGHQTLDLIILVRVQASQPTLTRTRLIRSNLGEVFACCYEPTGTLVRLT